MNLAQRSIHEIEGFEYFFNNSTKELTEDMSTFSPAEGMMTAAQQVAHAAQTVEWFVDGAFSPDGFDMDFEGHMKQVSGCTSLAEARARLHKAFTHAKTVVGSKTDAELLAPLPEGPVMGGQPRMAIISGMNDHTAHHRGALTVYARLKGKVPPMPYMG